MTCSHRITFELWGQFYHSGQQSIVLFKTLFSGPVVYLIWVLTLTLRMDSIGTDLWSKECNYHSVYQFTCFMVSESFIFSDCIHGRFRVTPFHYLNQVKITPSRNNFYSVPREFRYPWLVRYHSILPFLVFFLDSIFHHLPESIYSCYRDIYIFG